MITIVEGTRISTMGIPWYLIATDEIEEEHKASEAYVYLIDDFKKISREGTCRFVYKPNPDKQLPGDLDIEATLQESAVQFAESIIGAWQWEHFRQINASIVLDRPIFQQVSVSFLYRLWMGCFADDQIRKMHGLSGSAELKQCLSSVMSLPQLARELHQAP